MKGLIKIKWIFYSHDNIEDFLNDLRERFMDKDIIVMSQYEKNEWHEEPDFGGIVFNNVKWKNSDVTYDQVIEGDRGYANHRPPYIIVVNNTINLGLDDGIRVGKKTINQNDPYGEEDWEEDIGENIMKFKHFTKLLEKGYR